MLHRLSFMWPMKDSHENPSHDVFIQRDGKALGNLLGNLGTPKSRIAALHVQGELNVLPGRALRTRLPAFPRREEPALFPFDHCLMISQDCGRFDENGGPLESARINKDSPEA